MEKRFSPKEQEYIARSMEKYLKAREEEVQQMAEVERLRQQEDGGEEPAQQPQPQAEPQEPQEDRPWRSGQSVLTGRKIPISTPEESGQ